MKQNNLYYESWYRPPAEEVCLGKFVTVWALFGWAMAALWQAAAPTGVGAQAALWTLALLLGLGIAICLREL